MTSVDDELLDRVRVQLAQQPRSVSRASGVAGLAGVDGVDGVAPDMVAAALRADGTVLGDAMVLDVVEALRLESIGAGPLQPLLERRGVTDVLVNGPSDVFVDDGDGLSRVPVRFPDDGAVRRLAQRLAAAAGRRLDDSQPFVDARLPDGTRLHAALSPVARPGTCLSLRVPSTRTFALADMVAAGAFDARCRDLLADCVRSRAAIVISGGTGVGKTTLLAALLAEVPGDHRIVVVEDSHELDPMHPHVVWLEGRPANVEGAGLVSLRDLVRQALRMRPDRLVVGEVRGAEVVDLLAAMNTGHEGACTTLHANAVTDVPARFEALGVAAGLGRPAVHALLASSIDLVVHLVRGRDRVRRVAAIGVLHSRDDGLVEIAPAVEFPVGGEPRTGPGADRLESILARA